MPRSWAARRRRRSLPWRLRRPVPPAQPRASCPKQASDSLVARTGREFVLACDGGKKVISGGFASDGSVVNFDSRPIGDSTWSIYLQNLGDGNAGVTLYAVCVG